MAICVLGAALAMMGDSSPTSWSPADAFWRALFVAVCAAAGSRARRWTFLWGAGLTVGTAGTWWAVVAAVAMVAAAVVFLTEFRHRLVGAAIGGTIGLTALNLVRPSTTGATALLATAAVAPMVISGWRLTRPTTRRMARRAIAVALLLLLVGTIVAVVFGLGQRDAVSAAVSETRAAVETVGSDDPEEVRQAFSGASESFAEIREAADKPWMWAARAVPVVGSNVAMIRTAAAVGADLNEAAGEITTSVDQTELREADGGVDLVVLAEMEAPVSAALAEIESARAEVTKADSPWLLAPLQTGVDDLVSEIEDARRSAEVAEMAVQQAPGLLGADGPRRYLMLLGNPAESRDIGGHVGNWAEFRVADGDLDLVEVGEPYDLASPGRPLQLTPGAYPQPLVELRPETYPQNWGGTPDLPTVGRLAAELFPQARPGAPLDGVLYADPAAFAALLSFTGPAQVEGSGVTLTPDNAERFLTLDQFATYESEEIANSAVSDLIEGSLRSFFSNQLPSPRRLADVFGPLVEQGRLRFASLRPDDTELLDELGLLGQAERPGAGDLLGVMTQNTNPSKIDSYLRRRIEYFVNWDVVSGRVNSRVRIALSNTAAESGLPDLVGKAPPGLPPGTNRTTVAVLNPGRVKGATLDGEPVPVGTRQESRGVRRHSFLVDLPPGAERVLEVELQSTAGPGRYVLQWIGQPTVAPGSTDISIRASGLDDRSEDVNRYEFDSATDRFMSVLGR
jgi:hypothetical protein